MSLSNSKSNLGFSLFLTCVFIGLAITFSIPAFSSKPPLLASIINRPWPSLIPFSSPTPNNTPPATPTLPPAVLSLEPVAPTGGHSANISEGDLWNALVDYRASHGRTSIIREENLCAYARKRVAEHQGRTDLDNHSGFQRDADNGTLFSETGDFLQLGEVLAYLPGATTATQVLEWGWDSSSAHREGLLSDESTHACIVGTAPFYAGILGHR